MRIMVMPKNVLYVITLLFLIVAISILLPFQSGAKHAPQPPPTNLQDSVTRTNPGIHTLSWTPSSSWENIYYEIYRDGVSVDQTVNTYYQLNNATQYSGNYAVRAQDNLHGVQDSRFSNSVYVTLGYLWTSTGSPWNSCFTPGAPTPSGPYDGCFAAGSSMYALRNVNVKYNASAIRSGSAWMRVDYRQKFAALPAGFTKYDVNVIVGSGTNWQYVTTLQLPAGAPDVVKTVNVPMNIPIDHPGEVELQWVNDTSNSSGDANLQIDYIQLNRP